MSDIKTFKSFANYRKASCRLYRVDFVAQLEYKEDIPFWTSVIKYTRPNKTFKFYYADTIDGKEQSGKSVCKRYFPYADDSLIVCVDSDFDLFLSPGAYSVDKHILQTYTYSWENHYCFAASLQEQWSMLGIGCFNFQTFIANLNTILYPVLINLITARSYGIDSWHLLEFCGKVLHPSTSKSRVLDDDGKELLVSIQTEVSQWAKTQLVLDPTMVAQTKEEAKKIGLTKGTAYLYMRGHCIYDLILNIGDKLCGNHASFKYQVLDRSLQCSGYHEIDRLVTDARTIL